MPVILTLQMTNVFNVASLLVDLLMLKFLKSVVMHTTNVLTIDHSLEMQDNNGQRGILCIKRWLDTNFHQMDPQLKCNTRLHTNKLLVWVGLT